MYLGNSEKSDCAKTYYLPLLQNMIAKAKVAKDEDLVKKVAEQETLPKIKLLTKSDSHGLPKEANTLVTHGGYKLIYTHLEGDKYIIVLRDIEGTDKDESGRSIPFLLSIMCDDKEDLRSMNSIATYLVNYMSTAEKRISSMLYYDPIVNGLCFELEKMNQFIEEASRYNEEIELVNNKTIFAKCANDEIGLLVLPQGIDKGYALKELAMNKKTMAVLTVSSILPKDNIEEAKVLKERWVRDEVERKRQIRKKIAIGVTSAVVLGGIAIYLMSRSNG